MEIKNSDGIELKIKYFIKMTDENLNNEVKNYSPLQYQFNWKILFFKNKRKTLPRPKSITIKCSYIWMKHFHSDQIDIFDLCSFYPKIRAVSSELCKVLKPPQWLLYNVSFRFLLVILHFFLRLFPKHWKTKLKS